MGSFDPASLAFSALMAGMNTIQNRQQAKSANRQAQAQAAQKTAELNRARVIEERRRKDQLKRDTATQRTRFAAGGVGSRSGSATAVLQGLARPVDEAIEDTRLRTDSSINAINENLRYRNKVNLLEASRPLRRFAFNQVSKFGGYGVSLLDGQPPSQSSFISTPTATI